MDQRVVEPEDYKQLLLVAPSDAPGRSDWISRRAEATAKSEQSHYDILGINPKATSADLKKAYRKECLNWHPDKHQSSSEEGRHRSHIMFQKVNEAHEVLSNPSKRSSYDFRRRHSTSDFNYGDYEDE